MNWPIVPISSVAKVISGGTPKTTVDEYWGGELPWVTPKDLAHIDGKVIRETPRTLTNLGLKKSSAELLPPGSVLFSSRAPIGHVAINAVPMATNQGFKSMVPGEQLDVSFLYWWLRSHRAMLERMGSGATFKEVSKRVVESIEIPLPPLEEQMRIAAILDQADDLRRLRQKSIDRLNELGQAIFYDMFGDPTVNKNEYPVDELGVLCDVRDGTHDSPKYVTEGFPLLTSKNFSSGRIKLDGAKMISEADYIAINRRSKVDVGDVVMPMIGTIGSPVIIEEEPCFAIKNVALIKFRDRSRVSATYVHALLAGPLLEKEIAKTSRGGTQKFISLGDLRRLRVPVPPLKQQDQFGRRVQAWERVLHMVESGGDTLDRLFGSLQQRAFKGEL